jgi:hypothetical protein
MWPLFISQFNCGFLSNDAGGGTSNNFISSLILNHYLQIIYGLWCVRKLGVTAFWTMFYLENVASIHLAIQLRGF